MSRSKKYILITSIIFLMIALAMPALCGSRYRRGTTYRYKRIDIYNIESVRHESVKSGLLWYSFKANVRNKTNRTIYVTVCFQAVDRQGFELTDVCFYKKLIKGYNTILLTERTVMDARDYKKIWEWQIETAKIK